MYDKQTNEIRFPHIIPTPMLGGKKYTWDDVNGGATKIADLCLEQNTFWGGNVLVLGWVKELGMYACPNKDTGDILGFYVHDPSRLTESGKSQIIQAFPSRKVVFEMWQKHEPTAQEIIELRELKEYYVEHGMSPLLVQRSNAQELQALMKAIDSGKSEKSLAEQTSPVVAPFSDKRAQLEHDGSTVSPKILEGRMQPKRRA